MPAAHVSGWTPAAGDLAGEFVTAAGPHSPSPSPSPLVPRVHLGETEGTPQLGGAVSVMSNRPCRTSQEGTGRGKRRDSGRGGDGPSAGPPARTPQSPTLNVYAFGRARPRWGWEEGALFSALSGPGLFQEGKAPCWLLRSQRVTSLRSQAGRPLTLFLFQSRHCCRGGNRQGAVGIH